MPFAWFITERVLDIGNNLHGARASRDAAALSFLPSNRNLQKGLAVQLLAVNVPRIVFAVLSILRMRPTEWNDEEPDEVQSAGEGGAAVRG